MDVNKILNNAKNSEDIVDSFIALMAEAGEPKFQALRKTDILFDKIHIEAFKTFNKMENNEEAFNDINSLLDQFIKLTDDCIKRHS